uniref:Uncharacterized protein n=1 Tax=Nelumbo nucifera TaxID=4432 RepID=A0A822YRP7_NELNU|nr:TPA_asm: hypothetical protein HUJ06_005837 [Nelumbo nucifera]
MQRKPTSTCTYLTVSELEMINKLKFNQQEKSMLQLTQKKNANNQTSRRNQTGKAPFSVNEASNICFFAYEVNV